MMLLSGLTMLLFVLFHLWDFTISSHEAPRSVVNGEDLGLYGVVWNSFANPVRSLFYLAAMACLGLHLTHAISSVLVTLGILRDKNTPNADLAARVIGITLAVGFRQHPGLRLCQKLYSWRAGLNVGRKNTLRPIRTNGRAAKFDMKLVNPANKRKFTVIVVGTGLAGASASATLSELGYKVKTFCLTTPPAARTASRRRAASTPRRTTRTTATASTASSTTRSRAATSARARRMSIASPR
jgi:hypothetical protein